MVVRIPADGSLGDAAGDNGQPQATVPAAPQQGAPLLSDAEIANARALLAKDNQKKFYSRTPSSYDARNNFPVPTTPNYQYQAGQVTNWGYVPFDVGYNSGFLGVTDPVLQKLVVDAAGGDPMKYDTVWRAALQRAAYGRAGGNQNVSVEGILTKWGKSGVPSDVTGGGGGGPFRQVDRTVSLTDRGTANQIINNALTNYLGRQATDIEQKAFMKALNVQEKENPQVTVREGTTSGGNTTAKTTSSGGVNRDDFAQRFAKSQEGYAEYQAATTYLDAFIESLQNPMRAI